MILCYSVINQLKLIFSRDLFTPSRLTTCNASGVSILAFLGMISYRLIV